MGYSTERFLKSVDPNLICSICCGVLEIPVLIPCGHTYCMQCLTEWLSRPGVNTCPECRTVVDCNSSKPILSLRNLIQGMEAKCVHASRGCDVVIKLEMQQLHLLSCKFVPVTCIGCQDEVNISQLADHQINCAAIQIELEADNHEIPCCLVENAQLQSTRKFCSVYNTNLLQSSITVSGLSSESHVLRLLDRISTLEKQVSRLLNDLKESYTRNTLLNLQYRKAQDELEDQQRLNSLRSSYSNLYKPESDLYEYKIYSQKEIVQLSLLIARHLLDKPRHIDSNRVFTAVRNAYRDHCWMLQSVRKHDIHMLLATAYASNWFTSNQKTMLESWLQCVLQCQDCKQLVEG